MKIRASIIIDRICQFFLMISAIYLVLRIAMIVLTFGFDFSLFFRNPDLNLWAVAWISDVVIGFVALFSSILYLKNRILSFVLMLTTSFSLVVFIFAISFTEQITSIEDPILKENYAVYQSLNSFRGDEYFFMAKVYKEVFPLVYKLTDTVNEGVQKKREKKF
ncbi:hypothetical protein [Bacillus sp. FJAT-50079]|uniref:hypothetical protein n=1 Tax=Bacillus sp. FJAT-50079 TaxID=2833577 RepID=UPI001BC97099|nr:hypothetical protein [Bacillus sp. FJAT-50079]MBS4210838.1 hypothetical protein [Bacillus sp. FJAT-50079]